MLFGNTWLSCAAMQRFGTAMVTPCPQIRTVTHGGPVRCKRHCMPRVASTLSWMPEIPNIPFQTDEFGMRGNFDPPHLMKRVSHMLGGTSLVLQGELSYSVLQELHNHYDDPKPVLPPLP